MKNEKLNASLVVMISILASCSADISVPEGNPAGSLFPTLPNPASLSSIKGTWGGSAAMKTPAAMCDIELKVDYTEADVTLEVFQASCDNGTDIGLDETLVFTSSAPENEALQAYTLSYEGEKVGFMNFDGSQLFVEVERDGFNLVYNFSSTNDQVSIEGTLIKDAGNRILIEFGEGNLTKR